MYYMLDTGLGAGMWSGQDGQSSYPHGILKCYKEITLESDKSCNNNNNIIHRGPTLCQVLC